MKATALVTPVGFIIAAVALLMGATWWWLPFLLSVGGLGALYFVPRIGKFRRPSQQQQMQQQMLQQQQLQEQAQQQSMLNQQANEPQPTDLRIDMGPGLEGEDALKVGIWADPKRFAESGKFFDTLGFLDRQQFIELVKVGNEYFDKLMANKRGRITAERAAELTLQYLQTLISMKTALRQTHHSTPKQVTPNNRLSNEPVIAVRQRNQSGESRPGLFARR